MFLRLLLVAGLFTTATGCRRRRMAPQPDNIIRPTPPPIPTHTADPTPTDPDELQPGSLIAFGLVLPSFAAARIEGDETHMYHVQAQMPRVLRYLQQRLDYTNADIQSFNAMIRSARLRDGDPGTVLDIGIRDEGNRTLLTIWNRTPAPEAPSRSRDDQLRAAGYDPQTRRLDPRYNR